MRLNVVLAEPRLTAYVHVVGIEGESLDVIHCGLLEFAGQEMFGESVWVKTATLNIFSAYMIRKLICFNFTVGIRFYKSDSSQQFMSYNSVFNTHGFKKSFK